MKNFSYRKVNREIALWRKRRGLTQEQLAEQSELSKNFISKLETGSSGARLDVYYRIAKALGVSMDVLLKEAASPDSTSWEYAVAARLSDCNSLQKRMTEDFLEMLPHYAD